MAKAVDWDVKQQIIQTKHAYSFICRKILLGDFSLNLRCVKVSSHCQVPYLTYKHDDFKMLPSCIFRFKVTVFFCTKMATLCWNVLLNKMTIK